MAHAVDAVAAVLTAAVPVAAALVLLALIGALVWPRRAGGCPVCGAVSWPSETRCPVCGTPKKGGGR